MAKIRSALEIALERTEAVAADRGSVGMYEARKAGTRIANAFVENPSAGLEGEIAGLPEEARRGARKGAFDALVSRLSLPAGEGDLPRIEAAARGIGELAGDARLSALLAQLGALLGRYLGEAAQTEQALARQYGPRLRRKEEEISRRLGQEVRLDPLQDPEFAMALEQSLSALRDGYRAPVDQVREEAVRVWGEREGE